MIIKCNNRKCQSYQIDSANNASNIDIIDMDLPIKKHVLCNHCRTGWIICTVCNKMFSMQNIYQANNHFNDCLLYTSPSPRDRTRSRMPSSA